MAEKKASKSFEWAGFILGAILAHLAWMWFTSDAMSVYTAIKRRGYDVEALSDEKELDYWRSRVIGSVADPQPVQGKEGGE